MPQVARAAADEDEVDLYREGGALPLVEEAMLLGYVERNPAERGHRRNALREGGGSAIVRAGL